MTNVPQNTNDPYHIVTLRKRQYRAVVLLDANGCAENKKAEKNNLSALLYARENFMTLNQLHL